MVFAVSKAVKVESNSIYVFHVFSYILCDGVNTCSCPSNRGPDSVSTMASDFYYMTLFISILFLALKYNIGYSKIKLL